MREDMTLARIGDTQSFSDYLSNRSVSMKDVHVSLVARLGGHSAPGTHRGQERFPGHDHHQCFDSDGWKRRHFDLFVCRRCQFHRVFNAMCEVTSSGQQFPERGETVRSTRVSKVASDLQSPTTLVTMHRGLSTTEDVRWADGVSTTEDVRWTEGVSTTEHNANHDVEEHREECTSLCCEAVIHA